MKSTKIYLGETVLKSKATEVKGGFVNIQGEQFYKIENYDHMPDFFMTIVSDSDHWMFISSNGSLSSGRKNRDNALFPYYTDDKIHDYYGITGSKTIILAEKEGKTYLWEPFSKELKGIYSIERNLYKNIYGNKIIFEEINSELGIKFHYGWSYSEKYGFVKKSAVENISNSSIKLEILDGIRNILPSGVDYLFQNEYSNLLDAYKKNELLAETRLGLYMLSSIPVDRAEPSESLKATTVWSFGLPKCNILLSDRQTNDFTKGISIKTETDIRAARGAYFVNADLELQHNQNHEWIIVAEINQSTTDVANLNQFLSEDHSFTKLVEEDIKKGTIGLIKIVAGADGLQISNESLTSARHFSNTMFNVMRGGIFPNNYKIDSKDFKEFVSRTNKIVANELKTKLNGLPKEILHQDLILLAAESNNKDFLRICYEYLPLTFSRRHGDPSRPWNQFSIENKNEDGTPKLDFQGNWRDIFQNWEALSLSYPDYIVNIISKFVNASTPDGYNPYRIMRDGIDWECPDPDDPWAYIGYWGDHQIIYLQKLLELSNDYHPGLLDELLSADVFAYANVPYRIKPYQEIIKNPQDTITFDAKLNNHIGEKVEEIGADGRLMFQNDTEIYKVNLTEKILVTLLSKLSNFVPEAGIWLNTQRPEWNDANNALVGNGVSMVTLYYLRRFLKFRLDQFNSTSVESVEISEEVKELFDQIFRLFRDNTGVLENGFSDTERRYFTDVLGEAGTTYRNAIYQHSFSGNKKPVSRRSLAEFSKLALAYIDQSIRMNKRSDGLYHAYNLISFNDNGISIRHLYEMLEGQVAVLSSGYLSPKESLEVLDALKRSSLFREDQYSYLLYPDRELPKFSEKNNIPGEQVSASKLLSKLIAENDNTIVLTDDAGNYHFNGTLRNAEVLTNALDDLDNGKYSVLLRKEKSTVLNIYEQMFDHQSFTGRSGTFYGYEGLGSIYWHMVSKLLLAVEECFFKAVDEQDDVSVIGALKDHFYEIKAGIGLYKPPALYGAFPTDAYSHSPGNEGVKQPGMTGQVKEDIISRMGELGVKIEKGKIIFNTALINPDEILNGEALFEYYTISGQKKEIQLTEKQLAFTVCQVPVVYTFSDKPAIIIEFNKGKKVQLEGNVINEQISHSIFDRNDEVNRIEVSINKQD